ncbi:hypothetical protein DFQ27_002748 [Actinomortierella ambigua]|uniref:Uncharacterized protein n=1 Tax=Actinomortierella ambigua TaxID=1343610 RepID=A0A9P6Q8K5_9FUNG|nr:hypothetical protein DFQ27_002748 [Actinomortierella ambigua]
MTCYFHSQCVPLKLLCDPSLDGDDCDRSENQAPLSCGLDGICYSTNNQLPYPSPGKGAPSASQCDEGYFVALVGNKYTRSCLFRTMQPAAECSPWEYSYRGYCFLATCNATAPCPADYECRSVDPTTDTGVCRHPGDASDRPWSGGGSTRGGGNDGDDDDDDDDDDGIGLGGHYSTQDKLIEGLLVGTSSLLFGGLVGACFWYRKRRRERRIQWERQGHGSRQGSFAGGGDGVVAFSIDGHSKGSRFLPSWIERRWRPNSRHEGEEDAEAAAEEDIEDEDSEEEDEEEEEEEEEGHDVDRSQQGVDRSHTNTLEEPQPEDGLASSPSSRRQEQRRQQQRERQRQRQRQRQRPPQQRSSMSSSHGRRSGFTIQETGSSQDSTIHLPYDRQNLFSGRRWFWNFEDMGSGGSGHLQRQTLPPPTVIAMLDVSPEIMDPPPLYTRRPEPGLPTYGDVTGEGPPVAGDAASVGADEVADSLVPPPPSSSLPPMPQPPTAAVVVDVAHPPTLPTRPEAAVTIDTVSGTHRRRGRSIGSSSIGSSPSQAAPTY